MSKVRVVTTKRGKKRKTKVRMGLLIPMLYFAYLVVGMIFGIWVNGHEYAVEKAFYARLAEPPLSRTPTDDNKE